MISDNFFYFAAKLVKKQFHFQRTCLYLLIGYWLLGIGYWLLGIGYWLLGISSLQMLNQ